jgi:hypothetical protein
VPYSLQKDTEAALENLKQAIILDSGFRNTAENDDDFDGIRQDEQFQELMVLNFVWD